MRIPANLPMMDAPGHLLARARALLEQGIVESVGRGRGRRFLLARRFHRFLGTTGMHTRRRGLDRETNKHLLLKHIEDEGRAAIRDLEQVLPAMSRRHILTLLTELKREGLVRVVGQKRGSRWVKA